MQGICRVGSVIMLMCAFAVRGALAESRPSVVCALAVRCHVRPTAVSRALTTAIIGTRFGTYNKSSQTYSLYYIPTNIYEMSDWWDGPAVEYTRASAVSRTLSRMVSVFAVRNYSPCRDRHDPRRVHSRGGSLVFLPPCRERWS